MLPTYSRIHTHHGQLRVGVPAHHRLWVNSLKFFDMGIMALAFMASVFFFAFRPETVSLEQFLSMRLSVTNVALLAALLFLWQKVFAAFGLYELGDPPLTWKRIADVSKATTACALLVAGAAIVFQIEVVTAPALLFFWAAGTAGVISARFLLRTALRFQQKSAVFQRHALVVGTGIRALAFAREVESDPSSGLRIVGFVDDEWPGMEEFRESGRHVAADFKNFPAFLRENVVDEIVIAVPLSVLSKCRPHLFSACEEHGITVRFLSSVLTDVDGSRLAGYRFRDAVLLSVYHGEVTGGPLIAKRVMDLVLASGLVALLSPVFVGVAFLVKLSSPGPIFFAQERIGLNKRRFRMLKFRTMVEGAEEQLAELEQLSEVDGPVFKITDDPRMTPVGRWLRKTSIDELPQLLNVLNGTMSLVGPRPLPVRDYEGFDEDRHCRRFTVLPGLSGLWQVSGRSRLSFETWMELDLQYIDQWSLGLDLKILLKTIPAVLKGDGAS